MSKETSTPRAKPVRFVYLIAGLALLLLSGAKVVGLLDVLLGGADKPTDFVIKQTVYAVIMAVAGVSFLVSARQRPPN